MNALRKLSTGQRAAVAFAALVTAVAVTEIITGAGPGVRIVTVGVAALVIGCYFVLRLIGPHKGQRAAPRGWNEAGERLALPCERTIPRAPTEHAPPWGHAPFTSLMRAPEPAPVIEPAAITSGPPEPDPEPAPDAHIVITATRSGGRYTSTQVAVLPSLQWPAALPPWVIDILGADSVDGAMAEISRVARSFESNFTKGDARQVRAALTDGAS